MAQWEISRKRYRLEFWLTKHKNLFLIFLILLHVLFFYWRTNGGKRSTLVAIVHCDTLRKIDFTFVMRFGCFFSLFNIHISIYRFFDNLNNSTIFPCAPMSTAEVHHKIQVSLFGNHCRFYIHIHAAYVFLSDQLDTSSVLSIRLLSLHCLKQQACTD